MKTGFKKRGLITVLTAALLILAALVASCIDPLEGTTAKKQEAGDEGVNIVIPPGKGVIRLKVAEPDARTILPTTNTATLYYKVEFIGTAAAGANDLTIPAGTGNYITYAALTTPIPLTADTYDIVITAFDSAAQGSAIPVAGWDSDALSLGPYTVGSSSTAVTANLIGFTTGTDVGKFSYSVTAPAAPAATVMDVVIYGGGTSPQFNGGLPLSITAGTLENNSGVPLSLNPGYYLVTIVASASGRQARSYTRALHIYPTLTSTWAVGTIPNLVANEWTITFDLNTVTDTSGSDFATGTDQIQLISNAGTAVDPGDPEDFAGVLDFAGWYYTAYAVDGPPVATQKWLTTDRFFGNKTVYAYWVTPGALGDITLTVTFTDTDKASISGGSTTFSIADVNAGTTTLTFTLANPPAGSWTSWYWEIGENQYAANANLVLSSANTGGVLADITVGTFEITVVANIAGVPWTDTVTVTVTNP